MLFQDKKGRILKDKDLDKLDLWEIEENGVHVYD
jgi:hypothetical protein